VNYRIGVLLEKGGISSTEAVPKLFVPRTPCALIYFSRSPWRPGQY